METDRHYFIEGLFIIGLTIAAAFFFVWVSNSGHSDDVLYRIYFSESVNGLSVGDSVKFRGVDVGTVKTIALDPSDSRKVQVDVKLRKDAPVKTDTKASLKLKGVTGVVFIELDGGAPTAPSLAAATPAGQIPEIASEKSNLAAVLDQLPKVIEKFSAIEEQTKKVMTDVGEVTAKVKKNPLLNLGSPSENTPPPADTAATPKKEKASHAR